MISVVIVLAVLGVAGALVGHAGSRLVLAREQIDAAPADGATHPRRALESDLQALHVVLDRSVDAGRSER